MNRADLIATNSMIIRNTVSGGALAFGGGILLTTGSTASIGASSISQNSAAVYGGGIFMDDSASLQMATSHVYDNSASSMGGGIFVGPNGTSTGTVTSSTIADNLNYQMAEHSCPRATLNYVDNTVTDGQTGSAMATTLGGHRAAHHARSVTKP